MSLSGIVLNGSVMLAGVGRGFYLNALRFVVVAVGGYWIVAGVASAVAGALSLVLDRGEAVVLMGMLAFVMYLPLILWGFAERRVMRLWLVLGSGGAAGWMVSLLARSTGAV